jgi:hypothetical protein
VQIDDTIRTDDCPLFSRYIEHQLSTTAFPEVISIIAAIATQLPPLIQHCMMPFRVAKDVAEEMTLSALDVAEGGLVFVEFDADFSMYHITLP